MFSKQSLTIRNLKVEIYAIERRLRYYAKMQRILSKRLGKLQKKLSLEQVAYQERFKKIEGYKEVIK